MANQQRFEGQDLASVLERVREVHGEHARIIAANRVRKGGVGGFFAREHYEVVVEEAELDVSDVLSGLTAPAPAPRAEEMALAGSGDPFADMARRRFADDDPEIMTSMPTPRARPRAAARAERPVPIDITDDGPGHSILDLAEAVSEVERERAALRAAGRALAREATERRRMAPRVEPQVSADDIIDLAPDQPSLSTESAQFASILARIADGVDGSTPSPARAVADAMPASRIDDDEIPEAIIVSDPTVDDLGTIDEDDVWIDDEPSVVPSVQPFEPPRVTRVVPDTPGDEPRPVVIAPEHVIDLDEHISAHRARPRTSTEPTETNATTIAAPEVGPAAEDRIVEAIGVDELTAAASTIAPPTRREHAPVDEPIRTIERPEMHLVQLGVPVRMVPRGVRAEELERALAESLAAHLPQPAELPRARGVVVAAVGTGREAIDLARSLSVELSLDPEEVVVAIPDAPYGTPDWLVIPDAPSAMERRRSWQRRSHATVVAVIVDPERGATNGWDWAQAVLDNLEPTRAWLITDARSKPADIAACIDRLGGIDVLAVDHLEDTVSPASVLELGVPVGRIGGHVATPTVWSRTLVRRLGS